jgi:hypothetical protein
MRVLVLSHASARGHPEEHAQSFIFVSALFSGNA